jgi:hypothetical protein
MMNTEEKQDYRRKRNAWGFLIAIGWIIFWWFQKTDGSITGGLNYYLMCVVAVVTAPFAFIISHYVARTVVEKQSAQRLQNDADAFARQRQNESTEQTARMSLLQSEADSARALIDRGEFIKKIGTVRDYLGVLAIANDDSKRLLIRQSIDKELRDLIVKHDPQAMASLVQRDEAVHVSLASMLDMLSAHGALSTDAVILQRAWSTPALIASTQHKLLPN